jgi:CubicO group peptidase (beta-lactamase class C family)
MLAGVSTELPRSTPADQNVDPGAVLAFVDAVDADPAVELHSVMVLRHGQVVAEGWWAPHTPERTRLLYSLSKSFTSTALAFALQEGLVTLDDTLVSHFPEFQADITDPRSRSVTLRHLASMASGHNREMMQEAVTGDPREPVRGFLLVPPDEEPGSIFAYSQPCTYALGSVIQRVAGIPLTQYLRPRLFDPLGIGEVGWLTWPPGREQGFSGLFARTEDIAKLGQLYLQSGRWGDRQLIPESYVKQATSRQVDTAGSQDNPDWRQGYGFQFWMSRHGYRGDGALGQFCVVLPEQDAVVAITAGTENMQGVLDHLWRHLLPGFHTSKPDGGAQRDLDERLGGLRLPPCVAQPESPQWPDWTGRPFAVGHGTEGLPAAALTSVELRRGEHGLDVTIREPDNALTFPVGATGWTVSAPRDAVGDAVPVAASGGWVDDHTVRVELVFLESPHRMDIACTLPAGTAEAVWRNQPLEDGLTRQHRPG